jgi:hypothetical protein
MSHRTFVSFAIALIMIFGGLSLSAQNFGSETEDVEQQFIPPDGTDGLPDSSWPTLQQNLDHTGLSPYDINDNNGESKLDISTDSSSTLTSGSESKKVLLYYGNGGAEPGLYGNSATFYDLRAYYNGLGFQ